MGVSVVPALWKGMLQWCHGCRRELAFWWHNPQTSTLRPPAAKILIKLSELLHCFGSMTSHFTHQHHSWGFFYSLVWVSRATMEKRTKGSGGKVTGRNRKSSAQLHVDKKVDVNFLTVNICRDGKTTSCRETLPKCSSSVSKISGLLWAEVKGTDF